MKKTLLFFSLQILLFSCQQKTDRETIKKFARTIHIYTGTRSIQQAFVDNMVEVLTIIKNDNNAQIDTKQLNDLLEKAKQANNLSFVEISKIKEVNNEIDLRKKALAEIELYKSLYENEFSSTVKILESNEAKKFEAAVKLFTGKEAEIIKVQSDAKLADREFTSKYNITSTDLTK